VTRAKTVAEWQRDVPVYDKAVRDVTHLLDNWPDWRVPRLVAHIDPDTRRVSIVLHGDRVQLEVAAAELVGRYGYQPGGWAEETAHGLTFWRKTVTR
jgi:hypothetical protein